MAEDKDKDGFKVPSKPGEIIPATLLDSNDNDPKVGVAAAAAAGSSGTSSDPNSPDYNFDTLGYIIYDKNGKETLLNNATALVKYLKSLSPATIKSLKQQYANAGMYKAPVNGLIGPSDSIVGLIGNALQYQEVQGLKTTLNQSITAAIKDYKATSSASGASNAPRANVTSKEAALVEIQDSFKSMFGDAAPPEIINAYRTELNTLEMSRTSKTTKKGGVDVGTYGVSDAERKNLLNKYLNQYAKTKIDNAATGDKAAIASLTKGNFGLTYSSLVSAYSNNGIPLATGGLNFASMVIDSALNPDRLKANLNLVNLHAKTLFPALADKLDGTYTVRDLLTPYINSRANILEEDPQAIDISKLTDVAKDAKTGLMSLYDYEVSLRNDPKWRFTKNAQDSMSNVANTLAKTFGLVG